MLKCIICHDGIIGSTTNNNYPWALSCGHLYHKVCIDQALRPNNECPQCRQVVSRGIRLYPEVLNRDETILCLMEGIQSAEGQYTRQKNVSDSKEANLRNLQSILEAAEAKNTELRTANVNYAKKIEEQRDKLNTAIQKLHDDKKILNGELNKSAEKVARLESSVADLKGKLQREKDDKQSSEARLDQQIQALNRQLAKVKQETSVQCTSRNEELDQLRAEINDLQVLVNNANDELATQTARANELTKLLEQQEIEQRSEEERSPPKPNSLIDDIAGHFERLGIKRKFAEKIQREETSVKQQRSEAQEECSQDAATEGSTVEASPSSVEPGTEGEAESPRRRKPRREVRKMFKVVKVYDSDNETE